MIIKTSPGSYADDGWASDDGDTYRYSFKARKGVISYGEKANSALIAQPQHGYPVLLFTEDKSDWIFEGQFAVSEIEEKSVLLVRYGAHASAAVAAQEEVAFSEGGVRYVTHLLAERSRKVVEHAKDVGSTVCDICAVDFELMYGVRYIEAHHKVPISTFTTKHVVKTSDLALLCPNCHRSVHIYMKKTDHCYDEIKALIAARVTNTIGE